MGCMENNQAFIDGQNLYLGTKNQGWCVDHRKFRIYLQEKYGVEQAYYFLGYVSEEEDYLYEKLQKAGFILMFREHSSALKGRKKGNVDCDIVFTVMKKLMDQEDFNKIVLVSGDGDYKKMVDYLLKKGKFEKILFPNKEFSSSLYNKLGGEYFDYLDSKDVKSKISFNKNA